MREVSFKIAKYTLVGIGIAFILSACVEPADLGLFEGGDDDKAVSGSITIRFDVENYTPILSRIGTQDKPVALSVNGTPKQVTITVNNVNNADLMGTPYEKIDWYLNGKPLTASDGVSASPGAKGLHDRFTASTAKAPLNTPDTYQVLVVGILNKRPFEKEIYIKVSN